MEAQIAKKEYIKYRNSTDMHRQLLNRSIETSIVGQHSLNFRHSSSRFKQSSPIDSDRSTFDIDAFLQPDFVNNIKTTPIVVAQDKTTRKYQAKQLGKKIAQTELEEQILKNQIQQIDKDIAQSNYIPSYLRV